MASHFGLNEMYFSYGQFMVYDAAIASPECAWTEKHFNQGFARRDSTVCFGTLLEFGHAAVNARIGEFVPDSRLRRVIAVPFAVVSGTVVVEGPEEPEGGRTFELPLGNYRLFAGQVATGDEELRIELTFEESRTPLARSEIIVADDQLAPDEDLLEDAHEA